MLPRRVFACKPFTSVAAPTAWSGVRWCTSVSSMFDLPHDAYVRRHVGPGPNDAAAMLKSIGDGKFKTVTDLVNATIPDTIKRPPMTPNVSGLTESDALSNLRRIMMKNKLRKSLIGHGYYEALLPPAIQRNILENPGWYTPYTPYQAEISQGRLESLLNYQTVITELTGTELANASLLDEATSAVESIVAAMGILKSKRIKKNRVFVDNRCFPATIEMVRTRVDGFFGEVVVGDLKRDLKIDDANLAVILVQTPDVNGMLHDFGPLFAEAAKRGVITSCATDLMACTHAKPPGEMGADFVFGNAQRFGIPLGFGGPHPAFFAAKMAHKRFIPGRLIGRSVDSKGRCALRMALATREQHIKRENASSNICTAQALLANMVAFYSVYHGPKGIKAIADRIHSRARTFAMGAEMVGHTVTNKTSFFDTIVVKLNGTTADEYLAACEERRINVWKVSTDTVSVAFDEATADEHLVALLEAAGMEGPQLQVVRDLAAKQVEMGVPANLARKTPFLVQHIFNHYHSESDLMRYITRLQRKDYGLTHGMVPLGSCTMKLNAAATMLPMSWQRVTAMHPFVPAAQAEGYKLLATELAEKLKMVSGLDAVSLQPNSGAQGEYAGLRVIRAYQKSIGEGKRDIVIIPANAHGTNPATSVLCGLKPVTVKCLANGAIDMVHLQEMVEKHNKNISCAMITYPSTYGVFDPEIQHFTKMIHDCGGQVYIDGANFNAMVGHTGPGFFGGDVCHYNLHKTFSIPHGGGGPGMGPIACREHLAPFLPGGAHDSALQVGGKKSFGLVSGAPLGSASILTISYMLISMLGTEGMRYSTDFAILNANYLMHRLQGHYNIKFRGRESNLCAHEFILDMAPFAAVDVKAEDIAKRLMDYGFHAPTLAFPVANTLMVEPTESEPKAELDRFVNAMISIRGEIAAIERGEMPRDRNVLKMAPHPAEDVVKTNWDLPYSRELAAFPTGGDTTSGHLKFWPAVSRINNEYGDQNLFCSCGGPDQSTQGQ